MHTFFNHIRFQLIFSLIVALTLTCCSEQGACNDPKAINFDLENGNSNLSCQYAFDRDTLIGIWNVQESCAQGDVADNREYQLNIYADPVNPNQIFIENLRNVGEISIAQVDGEILTINGQTLSNDFDLSGSAILLSTGLQLTYTLNNGTTLLECQILINI